MKLKIKRGAIWLVCCLFGLLACHDNQALKQALIDKTVYDKVEEHKRKKTEACLREIIKEALIIADSVMIQVALNKVDTSSRINKPIKPIRPTVDLPIDTTPIKPLFEDSILNKNGDSLIMEKPQLISKDTISDF